jgi:hypothetical protein
MMMADDTKPGAADLSKTEVIEAQKQGQKDAIAEKAKIGNAEFDGLPGDDPDPIEQRFMGSDEVLGLEPVLELGIDQFNKAIGNGKATESANLSDAQLGGLYKLERNGQNRTPYVQALRKKLGLDKDQHVPGAGGPAYTNDVSNISEL